MSTACSADTLLQHARQILSLLRITDYSEELLQSAINDLSTRSDHVSIDWLLSEAESWCAKSSRYRLWRPIFNDGIVPEPIPEGLLPPEIIHHIIAQTDARVYQLYLLCAKVNTSVYYRYAHLLPVHCMLHSIASDDKMMCDVIDKARSFTDILPDDDTISIEQARDAINKIKTEDPSDAESLLLYQPNPRADYSAYNTFAPEDVLVSRNGLLATDVWGELYLKIDDKRFIAIDAIRAWPVVLFDQFDFGLLLPDMVNHDSIVDFMDRLLPVLTGETVAYMSNRIALMLMCRDAIRECNGVVDLANYLSHPIYQGLPVVL